MALANVAWILAANGKRVLIADWDLESPGLGRYFQPFINTETNDRPGIIDIIRLYVWTAGEAKIGSGVLHGTVEDKEEQGTAIAEIIEEHIERVSDYAIPLAWQFPDEGSLYFLSPGKLANGDYQATLSSLDWDNFYDNLAGSQFFDALRLHLKKSYDYVLIDSRTGLGDIADICTVHLPDVVVDCFTLATQGIDGAALIAKNIREDAERQIRILPVPMRIDQSDAIRVEEGLAFAARTFEGLLSDLVDAERRQYLTEMLVPYRPSYAYEEMLAAFNDTPGSEAGLLSHYERLTANITDGAVNKLPAREEWVRLNTRLLFTRNQSSPTKVVLSFCPEDQLWAEWIAAALASAEVGAELAEIDPRVPSVPDPTARTVAVVSDAYLSRLEDSLSAGHPSQLIAITSKRLPATLAEFQVIFLAGLPETQAVERLIEKFNGRRPANLESGVGALRHPGSARPQVENIPARNVNFTGRNDNIRGLREQLQKSGMAVVLPLTISGLGGVGKTQVALEYAHRFGPDYDIIWWMNCGQEQYVDASVADLGQEMRKEFSAAVPEEGSVEEVARQVLQLLSEGQTGKRWLLIYDNAEEFEDLKKLLPTAGGHVLITSRDERWTEFGDSLPLDVFKRYESVSHLRQRLPHISHADADHLAKVLGDMPLAVASAGALMATENWSVSEYLQRLDQQPERTQAEDDPLQAYPAATAKAWNLSLDQLRERSAAAAHLLEICAVTAPDISLKLIITQAMADRLRELDPSLSEGAMVSRLLRQIDRLALIKLDNSERQLQVHRVVQAVVNERMAGEQRRAARRDVHQLLVAARPSGDVDDPQMWPDYRLIWLHLTPSGAMWSDEERVRQLLIERVRYLRQRDDLERGARRAAEIEKAWMAMLAGGQTRSYPNRRRW